MPAPTTTAERSHSEDPPLEKQIRRRAYQRHVERAGQDGSDLQDWLRAEEEIRTAQAKGLNWNTPWFAVPSFAIAPPAASSIPNQSELLDNDRMVWAGTAVASRRERGAALHFWCERLPAKRGEVWLLNIL